MEVVKDEEILNDQLDFIGYFSNKQISLCLAWPFWDFCSSTTFCDRPPCHLLPGVLPISKLLPLLLRALSRLGSEALGEEVGPLWLGKGLDTRLLAIWPLMAWRELSLVPFLNPFGNHLGQFFLLGSV